MRATVISFIILAVIVAFLTVNGVLLVDFAEKLVESIDSMSDEPSEAVADATALCELWDKWEPFVSVSVVHLESEAVTDAVTAMLKYAEAGDRSEFNAAKAKFRNAVEHIRFSGAVSFETIL